MGFTHNMFSMILTQMYFLMRSKQTNPTGLYLGLHKPKGRRKPEHKTRFSTLHEFLFKKNMCTSHMLNPGRLLGGVVKMSDGLQAH